MALAGAFCYAEIGSAINKSGGEYIFLSKLFNPLVGYLSGWVSLTVGFAAPVALAAMALGAYLGNVLQLNNTLLAISVIVLISVIHSLSLNVSSKFQSYASWFKVLLILFLILTGLYYTQSDSALNFSNSWTVEVLTPSFAIAFVYVSYSYTGWNAASYIIEEIDKPRINLPKALVRGTLLVTLLYVFMQLVFLKHGTLAELQGQLSLEVDRERSFPNLSREICSICFGEAIFWRILKETWL